MIPRNLNEITPAYLTGLLHHRYRSAEVTGVCIHGEIHGSATKALLVPAGRGDIPRRMWLEAGWEPHSAAMAKVGIDAREPRGMVRQVGHEPFPFRRPVL